jgi:hypothetical protein
MQSGPMKSFTAHFATHVIYFLEIGCIIEPERESTYVQALYIIRTQGINYAVNESAVLSIREWQQLARTFWKSLKYRKGV